MNERLAQQIAAIERVIEHHHVADEETARLLGDAARSLRYIAANDEGIKAYLTRLKAYRESPMGKAQSEEFPDATVLDIREIDSGLYDDNTE